MSRQRHRHPLEPPVPLLGVAWGFFCEPLRHSAPQRGGAYRPEIDGLRALAVLAVIANHLNQAVAREGFLSPSFVPLVRNSALPTAVARESSATAITSLIPVP